MGRTRSRAGSGPRLALVLLIGMFATYHLMHASAIIGPAQARSGSTPAATSAVPSSAKPIDCAVQACVALTFDDGPGPYTDQLLDVLAEQQVRVTFFVLGASIERYPDSLRRAVADGHEIGNRSAAVDAVVGGPEILWSVDPKDWEGAAGSVVVDRVLSSVQPGSIVLLHDIKAQTVAAVPEMIDGLRAEGFEVVTVSRLFAGVPLQDGSAYAHRS